jgi:hypothetical protein
MKTSVPAIQEAVLMDKYWGKLENSFVVSILCFGLGNAIVLPRQVVQEKEGTIWETEQGVSEGERGERYMEH